MTPADITRAAADYELHKRALASCMAAEPHVDADEDIPCTRHIAEAARSLAIPARHVGRATPYTTDMREADMAERRMFGGTP